MSKLWQIRETVQHVAEAISSVLGVEVTIADEHLQRIAGTGHYANVTDKLSTKAALFNKILQSGQGVVVHNPRENNLCLTCDARRNCFEQAEVCCPIKINRSTIGVIALVAFTTEQKETLLQQQHKLFRFLEHMADLLAGKVAAHEQLIQVESVKNQLQTVINSVHEGILVIDYDGAIVDLNHSAQNLLGLKIDIATKKKIYDLFDDFSLKEFKDLCSQTANREIACWLRGHRLHCVLTLNHWLNREGAKGFVATLQEMEQVKKIISRYGQEFDGSLSKILGTSPAFLNVKQSIALAARSNSAVLIQGESGTGKELFAKALHQLSQRKNRPFIAINCAAIPENLLEPELFGYEEGAFTGARRGGKMGKFELANGGTLFLDEIGDMPLLLQAKLLRVLQEQCIEKVGATKSTSVDVRIVSATHKNLEKLIETGQFRHDLYYRIQVFPILIPPLRQRKEDLPVLIKHFLEKYRLQFNKPLIHIAADAYNRLLSYNWPGNVRELENVMEYLVNIENNNLISYAQVCNRLGSTDNNPQTTITTLAEAEKQLILTALTRNGFTVEGKVKTAQTLGISLATLYRKLKEYSS